MTCTCIQKKYMCERETWRERDMERERGERERQIEN